ncbi:MAG: tRNA pseudouridine(38-40) synthase TruA [Bacteroidota bacterium]
MPRYFIHMAYDGTAYHGWQVQPNGKTVQEVIQHALSMLLRQDIAVTGAGRTDTGVHASFFVAHFDLLPGGDAQVNGEFSGPDDERFLFRLNRFLPEDIVAYNIRQVDGDLHARYSATYRTYHYHLCTVKPLYNRHYSHFIYGPLDLEEIGRCCKILLDTEDFTSFSKLHSDVKTGNCHVMAATWKEVENGYLFEIRADRFLRNMVRSVVGTLLEVGQGKLDSAGFQSIIESRDRGKAGQSAPAHALFLVDIGYPD